MLRKIIFPLLLGIAGCAVLIGLGIWQIQRLDWKEGVLADIDARLAADPRLLAADMTEAADEYTRVTLSGTPTGRELHVLTSGTAAGTGYLAIAEVQSDIGSVLVDLGLLPIDQKDATPLTAPMEITGTLLWPDDRNSSTPDPDMAANIWFARDVAQMADALGTLPLLVVATEATPADPRLTPLPIATANIKNDHLEYAITWFLLALVWAVMSLYLIRRTLRPKKA